MRLLHTKQLASGNFAIEEFTDYNTPPYAILSHTWEKDEVSFQDMEGDGGKAKPKKGFEKIRDCCSFARANGFDYAWIDTCCIDKASSAELSEALNSMYRWYEEAEICYAFLADISSIKEFKPCRWFDRGWTLQELIAPADLLFVNKDWEEMGSRKKLRQTVSLRTGIPVSLLAGESDLDTFSVAQKMSWAAHRKTTRVEDRAYSLMGLFGVHMPLLYGERETAFVRLQKEILQISDDHSIFAWRDTDRRAGLLASSPASFSKSHDIIPFNHYGSRGSSPTVSSRGIFLELRFVGLGPEGLGLVLLPCKRQGGDRLIALYVKDLFMTMQRFERVWSGLFELVHPQKFGPFRSPMQKICVQVGRLTGKGDQPASKWDVVPEEHPNLDELCLRSMTIGIPKPGAVWDIDQVWLVLAQSEVGPLEAEDSSGRRPLLWAAMNGHEGIVNALLDRGALIEGAPAGNVRTYHQPLTAAIINGHNATAELLIERGAGLKEDLNDGPSPLALSAQNGCRAIVKLLLERGASIEGNRYARSFGVGPLTSAVENGDEAIVEMLIEKGAALWVRNCDGRTPLIQAARFGRESIARLLIEKRGVMEIRTMVDATDHCGRTALSWAAEGRCPGIVKLLLEHGATVDWKDQNKKSPLVWAIQHGLEACSKLLLEAGALVDTRDESGRTPLFWAAQEGCADTVKLLFEKGAAVGMKQRRLNDHLILAAQNQHDGCSRLFIEAGASVETHDEHGLSPLHLAIKHGSEPNVRLFLEKGASVESKTGVNGPTPLSLAAERGNLTLVKLLLERGARVEMEDSSRPTALWWAVQNESEDMVKLLLERGASHRVAKRKVSVSKFLVPRGNFSMTKYSIGKREVTLDEDDYYRTPLSLAEKKRLRGIVRLLLDAGAKESG